MHLEKIEEKIEDKSASELIYDNVVGYDEYFDAVLNATNYDSNTKLSFSYKELEGLSNLKSLTINHQPNLRAIDLSGLRGLKKIEICHNYNLKSIFLPKDLGEVQELSIMCNNDMVNLRGEELVSLIKGAVEGRNKLNKIKVDASYYFDVVGALGEELKNDKFSYLFNETLVWCDNVSTFGQTELSTKQMCEFADKIENFLESVQPLSKENQIESFCKIYAKFITTFKYDRELLDAQSYRNALLQYLINVDKGKATRGQKSAFARLFKTNHCYDIFEREKAVCQGLSKALIMMLKKYGIEANEIVCIAGVDEFHSIVKITLANDRSFIVDPTWDIKNFRQIENTTIMTPAIKNKYIWQKIDFNNESFMSMTESDYKSLKQSFSSALKAECNKFKLREVEMIKKEENAKKLLDSEFEFENNVQLKNQTECENYMIEK